MSDRTEHVIDAIDGALEDYSVSGDAMRWTPEKSPDAVEEPPVWEALRVARDNGRLVGDERATPSWMRGLRVIEDPAVPPDEVILSVDRTMEEEPWEFGRLCRFTIATTTVEARIHAGLAAAARADLIERMAVYYGLPACLIEHRFSPWAYDPERHWYVRTCGREDCPHWEAQHASLGVPQW